MYYLIILQFCILHQKLRNICVHSWSNFEVFELLKKIYLDVGEDKTNEKKPMSVSWYNFFKTLNKVFTMLSSFCNQRNLGKI